MGSWTRPDLVVKSNKWLTRIVQEKRLGEPDGEEKGSAHSAMIGLLDGLKQAQFSAMMDEDNRGRDLTAE
ncbi:MAG: hypothetical protein EOM24_01230 [Chloroflexia bacterium]|nr:hypothetical protein [Chloroflexia bacterium]